MGQGVIIMDDNERDKKIDKLVWDVDKLKQEKEYQNSGLIEREKRIRKLESFKDSTVEKLITVFSMIEDIKENDKWIKRTFTAALITMVTGAIASILVWLIQS